MIIINNTPTLFKNYQQPSKKGFEVSKKSKEISVRFADVLTDCIKSMDKERVRK